jgi:hypothetical protein
MKMRIYEVIIEGAAKDVVKWGVSKLAPKSATSAAKNVASKATVVADTLGFSKTQTKGFMHWLRTAGYLYILYQPLEKYESNMEAAETHLNAANPSDRWTEAQFEYVHKDQLRLLVGKWATILGTGVLIKIPFTLFGKLFGNRIGNWIVNVPGSVRVLIVEDLMSDPKNLNVLAELMTNNVVGKGIANRAAQLESLIIDRGNSVANQQSQTIQSLRRETPIQ